jgi:hypothetical protein
LAVADVERDDMPCAALQEHVGEPAGGRADVQRESTGHVDVKCVERVRELQASASDERMVRRDDDHVRVVGDRCSRFHRGRPIHAHLPGQHQRARAFSRRRQAAGDEQQIETLTHRGHYRQA